MKRTTIFADESLLKALQEIASKEHTSVSAQSLNAYRCERSSRPTVAISHWSVLATAPLSR